MSNQEKEEKKLTLEERVDKLEENILDMVDIINSLHYWATDEAKVTIPYIDFSGNEELMLPKRNKAGDIGYDAYAHETVTIPAHGSAKVPLGIGAIIPRGFSIAARTRGGRWLNGLLVGDAHVDLNYRGQINALLYNVTDKDITIEKGERPCSIDLFKTYEIEWQPLDQFLKENNLTEENVMNTNRGDTGFGNSGK